MQQDLIVTSVRLPAQVKRRGKIEAAKNDTTLSELMRKLLENYLDQPTSPIHSPRQEATYERA